MARVMAIDYGGVRTGLAVTDPLQIIATALDTISTAQLDKFLSDYFQKENVEAVVIGYPTHLNGTPADIIPEIDAFIGRLQQAFPMLTIIKRDERLTSKMAYQTIIHSGIGKKARSNKGLIDRVSATIILQEWMESQRGPSFPM